MDAIQVLTEDESNIRLLKLRDVLYDRAKLLNKLILVLAGIPIIYTVMVQLFRIDISYFKGIGVSELGVLLSLLVSAVIYALSAQIQKYKFESNIVRQAYDCKVFNIKGNKFIIPEKTQRALEHLVIGQQEHERYDKWYGQIFTGNKLYDILMCQVDNLLYTIYLYNRIRQICWIALTTVVGVATMLIGIAIFNGEITNVFFGYMIPCAPIVTVLFSSWGKIKRNVQDYKEVMEVIKQDIQEEQIDEVYLEAIQDKILINRLNDVLVPKLLREHYLKEGNEYKAELSDFKRWLLQYVASKRVDDTKIV